MRRLLVWDLPTRLFHWLLAGSFAAAWLTSGEDPWLSVHIFFGYLVLGLIIFRLYWGVAGGPYARFAAFAYGPKAVLAYVRALLARRPGHYVSHNPAGSWAVYLLLTLGVAVCITGVFTQGGEEQHGPVAGLISIAAGSTLGGLHEVIAELMLAVVAGHLAGVALDTWITRENLVRSMFTGLKEAPDGSAASGSHRSTGIAMVLAVAGFAAWWFAYALYDPLGKLLGHHDQPGAAAHVAFVGQKLADDATWREECGSCHLAFHPSLLPARSWEKLMADQAGHFGSDLALDAGTTAQVLAFLVGNAAEHSNTEAAYKINRSIAASDTPLRITGTAYWVSKHHEIAEAVWQRAKVKSRTNCAACHLDADGGTFEDAAMRIPP